MSTYFIFFMLKKTSCCHASASVIHCSIMGKRLPPSRFLVAGFALVILLGSLLLSLPIAWQQGRVVEYIDALFISASAVCVTGLTTVDVGGTFSLFGRITLAILIMVGGMGFMAVITVIITALGLSVGIGQRTLVSEAYRPGTLRGTVRLVRTVVMASLSFQLMGTVVFFFVFTRNAPVIKALELAAFHAISAFNNAGFDLLGSFRSLTGYRDDVAMNAFTALLIISGGIGFFVLGDVANNRRWKQLTVHTRIVLTSSAALIIGGALVLKSMGGIGWLAALFQSITARTAGFNTVDIGSLPAASQLVLMLLMFVGASPGSTGGGIKTTTAFAIAASVFALVFRHEPVAFKRKLGNESLLKAFHVLVLASSVVVAALFLLLWIEHERFTFLQVAFEAVSAFATVGLSTGITPSLQDPSKLVFVVVMFIGRVGPITVATALKGKESSVKHVEERIIIG